MAASANVVLAKVRAMYGRRLRPEDYGALLRSHSVSELAGYLKNHTDYQRALADVNENTLHRSYLETVLRRFRFERFAALSRYETMTHMPLSDFYIRLGEIQQLLLFLRLLGAGRPEEYFFNLPYYFSTHSRLNLIGLADVRSFSELLTLLEDTPYLRPIRQFPPDEQGRLHIPEIETALYTDWYEVFFRRIDRLPREAERQQLTVLLSCQLDIENVLRIYRMKTYFHMPPEHIRLYLVAPGRGMPEKQREQLLQAPADRVLPLFQQMPQGRKIPGSCLRDPSRLPRLIPALEGRHYIHYSVFPSVVLLSYMFLSNAEVDDVVHILEGIRYNLPPEQIRQLLTAADL